MKTRQEALSLLHEWVKSESLKKHCLSVAAAMEGYAKKYWDEGKIDIASFINSPTNPYAYAAKLSEKEQDIKEQDDKIKEGNYSINNKSKNNKGNLSEQEKQAIIDKYWITGLLHDFDWEKYPTLQEHPIKGCTRLRELEYDEEIIEAILGHNKATGIPRRSLMAKTLFAVDELCGLIIALAYVRPGNFDGMSAQSVKKAIKKKDFAANISREDIAQGIKELEVNENEHLETVIKSLSETKKELGF